MSHIKTNPTLRDLQEYTALHWRERGFDNTAIQECLLLAEEVGELAKAIRKDSGLRTDSNSEVGDVAYELVDVMWITMSIANLYGVDLEKAFREKEAINHQRVWS